MFRKILDHPNIDVNLNCDVSAPEIRSLRNDYDYTIYSGPVDEFYDLTYGRLQYRSLRFVWTHLQENYGQPCVQINYPNDFDYTRKVEIKHVTGQKCRGTTICYEYPERIGEPFYPVLTEENQKRYNKYKILADRESLNKHPIIFLGRLAEYKYYNMDHTFVRAIETANRILGRNQVRI